MDSKCHTGTTLTKFPKGGKDNHTNVIPIDFKNRRRISPNNKSTGMQATVIALPQQCTFSLTLIEGNLTPTTHIGLTAKQAMHHVTLLLRGLQSKYIKQYGNMCVTTAEDADGTCTHYVLDNVYNGVMATVLAKIIIAPE